MDKKEKIVTEQTAYSRVARLCAQKEYAPLDIAGKLYRMNLSQPQVDKIIQRLKAGNYLDEKRFIRSYIHDKLHFNKWGKKKIILFLKQKQLPQELIDDGFAEFPDQSFHGTLLPILREKWKHVNGKSDYEKRGKLIRYALGRGFSMEEVLECIHKMEINE